MSITEDIRALESSLKAEKLRAERARKEADDAASANQELSRQLNLERRTGLAEHSRLMKQIEDLRLVNKRLTAEQDSLRAQADNSDSFRRASAAVEKARSELADANSRIQFLTRDLVAEQNDNRKDAKHARDSISSLNEVNHRLSTQQNAMRAEIISIRDERDKLRKAIASSGVTEKTASDIRNLNSRIDSLLAAKRGAEQRADSSERSLIATTVHLSSAQRRITDLEVSLNNSSRLLSEARKESLKMKEQVAKATGEAEHARRVIDDSLKIPGNSDTLSTGRHVAALKRNAEKAQHRVTELEGSVTRLTGQLSEARNECADLRWRLANVAGTEGSLRSIITQKDKEIAGLRIKLSVAKERADEG